MTKLKPCPFCGSEPRCRVDSGHIYYIECGNLACTCRDTRWYKSDKEAAAAWNTRKQPQRELCESCGKPLQSYCKHCRADNWISVSDRLPIHSEYVLAYMPEIDFHTAILRFYHRWVDDTNKRYVPKVTHWRELPAPPDTGREG